MSLISKCFALLLLYISAATAYPELSTSLNAHAEDVPFLFTYNDEDFRFGNVFINVFTDIGRDKLEKKDVKTLLNLFGNAKSFSSVKPIIDRMSKITEIKDQDTFFSNCEIVSKNVNEATESIDERMNITLDKYCRTLFLKRISQLSSNINLSSRDLSFLKASAPFYIKGDSTNELVLFLKHFKSNPPEHEKISEILIDSIIELKSKPPSSLLTNIRVNTKFNLFLQNNINTDDTSLGYFQDEYQRTIREAQDAIDKSDYTLAKKLALGAVQFFNKNKQYISEKRAFIGLVILAKAFYYKDKNKDAIEIFQIARTIASKEDYSEASFYLIWPYIVDRDVREMKKTIEKYSLDKEFDKFDSKLQYWIAYAESKVGDSKKSQDLFNKIISNSPYSFYTIIALKDLTQLNKGKISDEELLAKLVNKTTSNEISVNKFSVQLKDSLRRFAIWSKLGNERFQTLEIRFIQNLSKENSFDDFKLIKEMNAQTHREFITLNLLKLLNSKKRYITSFKVFQESIEQNTLGLNLKIIKQIFPLSYFDIIKKNSLNMDPLMVISLIRQESAFNPEANSGVGAKGLMQLMPATAKRFNNRIKVKHLSNPEINVALGTKYLRVLISRFDGNLVYALASYNAGENRIDRWRKEIFKNDDPLSNIESIPFEETRNYVKLIYRNYFFYNVIQNKSILKTPIEESFKVTQYQKVL